MKTSVDYSQLPHHIAVIMDGNGRWAKRRFQPRKAGHRAGAQALRRLCESMNDLGFKELTVFAFSTENWKRSDEEVADLMNLLREYIRQYIEDTKKNNMVIDFIGDLSRLPDDLRRSIFDLRMMTKRNAGMRLNIAINYGGRDEIVRAAKQLAKQSAAGDLNPDGITEAVFADYLDTKGLPDPDLLIRTSGEKRLSNFMLWQSAYSELFFTDKLWPDFTIEDMLEAVSAFQNRVRRFGNT